jgi:hypothetical protein
MSGVVFGIVILSIFVAGGERRIEETLYNTLETSFDLIDKNTLKSRKQQSEYGRVISVLATYKRD